MSLNPYRRVILHWLKPVHATAFPATFLRTSVAKDQRCDKAKCISDGQLKILAQRTVAKVIT